MINPWVSKRSHFWCLILGSPWVATGSGKALDLEIPELRKNVSEQCGPLDGHWVSGWTPADRWNGLMEKYLKKMADTYKNEW